MLVYVLLAERCVEIVADRGIDSRVEAGEWKAVCDDMHAHFRDARFEPGAVAGVRGVGALLARHFAGHAERRNELADRPVLM